MSLATPRQSGQPLFDLSKQPAGRIGAEPPTGRKLTALFLAINGGDRAVEDLSKGARSQKERPSLSRGMPRGARGGFALGSGFGGLHGSIEGMSCVSPPGCYGDFELRCRRLIENDRESSRRKSSTKATRKSFVFLTVHTVNPSRTYRVTPAPGNASTTSPDEFSSSLRILSRSRDHRQSASYFSMR